MPAEVQSRLAEWPVFVLTSAYEGMPFAILEALAAGVPVVARSVVGSRDAIRHGVTGLLVRSPAEAADAITRFFDDEALRAAVGRAAQAEATTRFSPRRLGEELSRVYRLER